MQPKINRRQRAQRQIAKHLGSKIFAAHRQRRGRIIVALRIIGLSNVALALAALGVIAGASLIPEPVNAAVYCRAVGVPKGCIVRPTRVRVVYCTAPGLPVGCVVRPVAAAAGGRRRASRHHTRCLLQESSGVPKGCVVR